MKPRFSSKAVVTPGVALLLVAIPIVAFGADNPDSPNSPVKLVFVHHSTGGNWLCRS